MCSGPALSCSQSGSIVEKGNSESVADLLSPLGDRDRFVDQDRWLEGLDMGSGDLIRADKQKCLDEEIDACLRGMRRATVTTVEWARYYQSQARYLQLPSDQPKMPVKGSAL